MSNFFNPIFLKTLRGATVSEKNANLFFDAEHLALFLEELAKENLHKGKDENHLEWSGKTFTAGDTIKVSVEVPALAGSFREAQVLSCSLTVDKVEDAHGEGWWRFLLEGSIEGKIFIDKGHFVLETILLKDSPRTSLKNHLGSKYCSGASHSSVFSEGHMKVYKEKTEWAYSDEQKQRLKEEISAEHYQKMNLYRAELNQAKIKIEELTAENKALKEALEKTL